MLGAAEVQAFLSHLSNDRHVAAATQNQAKAALLFLYKEVLQQDLPWLEEIVTAKGRQRLPVVLTPSEVTALLHQLSGTQWMVASLLYGTGMRLLEGLRLRVQDVEFQRREVLVRNGTGGKDRVTVLPENLVLPLRQQLEHARARHLHDLAAGHGKVWLPHALAVKYPNAARAWGCSGHSLALRCRSIPATASSAVITCMKHRSVQKSVAGAARRAGIVKPCSPQSCATRSPRTFCRPATTSARFRNCSATPMYARR